MDLNKWKRRLENNIVTRDMIDNMYIKAKITLEEYLYITGLTETELVQEAVEKAKESLDDKIIALSEENKALKEQNEVLNERLDFCEDLIAEMATMLYS